MQSLGSNEQFHRTRNLTPLHFYASNLQYLSIFIKFICLKFDAEMFVKY